MSEDQLKKSAYMFSGNAEFIEDLYEKYLNDQNSVDQDWQDFFKDVGDDINSLVADYTKIKWDNNIANTHPSTLTSRASDTNIKIASLINSYRRYGHLAANTDPLGLSKKFKHPLLLAKTYNITDQSETFVTSNHHHSAYSGKNIQSILSKLDNVYCSNITYEFDHINNEEELKWLYNNIESPQENLNIVTNEERQSALEQLHDAVSFEQMLHKKFPGAKRFSVEGGEAIIPSIEAIIKQSLRNGVLDVELGMAHRGRLNVLTNIMKKPYSEMIAEFKGACPFPDNYKVSGDVKYHMGYSSDRFEGNHKTHVALAYNPSHLEAVNSVVIGKVRAKQDFFHDDDRSKVIPILIHGDAAFMGQGTVAECLNMAYVDGYNVGGTIHLIINNQIGFTATPSESRSTKYCSDVAKFIESPIIHVNGNSVDEVIFASKLAYKYRQTFKKDIVLDIVCFRKYGHNEGDEPAYTQPIMYTIIKKLNSLDNIYAKELIESSVISDSTYDAYKAKQHKRLEEEFQKSEDYIFDKVNSFSDKWSDLTTEYHAKNSTPKTGIEHDRAIDIIDTLTSIPNNFKINTKIAKQQQAKHAIVKSGTNIDWALGESIAYASLLQDGYSVRLSGQDSGRGTFSHRHSILVDSEDESRLLPLNKVANLKNKFEVFNSVLSEYSVLGFEYGYSLSNPNCLAIWEGQFGDFANGAQIIIDQFIASGETKWLRMSGVTLLLPHGYEGQGPEHSSARLERFLQLCAEDNMQIVNTTTPANFFHLLRQQMLRDFRKPLIVMSPKSLLRHKLAVSNIEDFEPDKEFLKLIRDPRKLDKTIKRIIFCSGKIYYDLAEAAKDNKSIMINRIEQLYPFPKKAVKAVLDKSPKAEILWVQEESKNAGAWTHIRDIFLDSLETNIRYVGRIASASPATGYMSVHVKEQKDLIEAALT
ncbi:MAG: 2-oxoglutarate dehydrogenase E1 component [Rickettsiales bacterium]|jgi:2-oxoglutarate dehydrogenase E1 component|nr:2-oxoglutarate dehydrogenase E1 component [Rickettsiales bacterium]